MSENEVIIRLTLVTLLGAYLVIKHWQRERQESLADLIDPDPVKWDGTAFDARALRVAMAESAVDLIELARSRTGRDLGREKRLDEARHRILALGWFRHRLHGEAAEANAA
jgi:hypothetical protein